MRRSRVDWALEGVAVVALFVAVLLALSFWTQIPERVVFLGNRYGRMPGIAGLMTAKNTLWMVCLIDVLAYTGLTAASSKNGLFEIPPDVERDSPHLRQMLFSMVIVMKAVLALFAVYLVWALGRVGLREGGGLSGWFLTAFTLAVPVPLVFYTLKMRRYQK